MSKTVEVPVEWLERLIKLGEQADVKVTPGVPGLGIHTKVYQDSVILLKGYIQSAESLIQEGK